MPRPPSETPRSPRAEMDKAATIEATHARAQRAARLASARAAEVDRIRGEEARERDEFLAAMDGRV
jgi:hypothetical protein